MNADDELSKPLRSYQARDCNNDPELFQALYAVSDFQALHATVRALLQVPNSLAGLWQISRNLRDILPLINSLSVPDIAVPLTRIKNWLDAVDSIPGDASFRFIEILDTVTKGTDPDGRPFRRPPFGGIIESSPVWVALWYSSGTLSTEPTHRSRYESYHFAQALYLAIQLRLVVTDSQLSRPNRINEAGLLLRKIHHPHYGAELDRFADIHDIEGSFNHFKINHENGVDELRQGYGAFADLLSEAFDLGIQSVFRNRIQGGQTGPRKNRAGYDSTRIYPDHILYWMCQTGISFDSTTNLKPYYLEVLGPGEEEEPGLLDSGLHPDEFAEPTSILFDPQDFLDPPSAPGLLSVLPPLNTIYAAAQGRYRAEVMRAQAFRTRLDRPHVNVVARLLGALETLYFKANATPSKNSESVQETLRLCAVAIVTGQEFRDILQLLAVDSMKDLPGQWNLAFSPRYKLWLRPYPIPDRNPLAATVFGKHVEILPRVTLSDIWSVGSKLPPTTEQTWFNRTAAFYEKVFTASILPELVVAGIPVQWSSSAAFGRLLPAWFEGHEEGELLRICAFFGRESPQSQVQAHYVALDRQQLDQRYCNIMTELWQSMLMNGFVPQGLLFELAQPSFISPTMTGNDWAPKTDSIKVVMETLQNHIRSHQTSNPYQHHNLVACYVGVVLGIVTAFRNVRTPVLDLTLIDQETGFLPLQEKDRSDGAHARLVWIPPRVRELIDDYLGHLRRLWTTLPFNFPTELTVSATKYRDRQAFGSDKFSLSLQRTLFLFTQHDRQWIATEFSGRQLLSSLHVMLPGYWNIPNLGRHLSATFMFNSQGSYATLDKALLGHWHLGESPWLPDSGYDPIQYRDYIAPKMEALLNQIGFHSMRF
ncbi:hypothetical protein FEMY_04320 [Ferrovum myxofaciens]|uniref:Uncharacterized protein n=1 Tax=Ferrovum myxofaciens TaxID=416213 RepID=A0A149W0U8_9PROT|nr:hypothetical protein [Ferrovum myxofaciens]KXW59070.1 hypothetical protein FEMY_04320 [Ferrovum myxofaciens]